MSSIERLAKTELGIHIETVRNNVGIAEIIQRENVIVLIGDSWAETQERVARRAEFEQLAPRVKIVT